MSWIEAVEGGVLLRLRIVPNASKNELAGLYGDALKVRVQSPALEGRANAALQKFIAKKLGLSKSAVELVGGAKSRDKQLLVHGLDPAALASLLEIEVDRADGGVPGRPRPLHGHAARARPPVFRCMDIDHY